MAGFARLLTEAPWTVEGSDIDRLRAVGVSDEGLEQALAIAAMFNYFTRVADGTGIEFDYDSPLPRIEVDATVEPLPRPLRDRWDMSIDGSRTPSLPRRPHMDAPLAKWREYTLDLDDVLTRAERRRIVRAVADELCDDGPARAWTDALPTTPRDAAIDRFARALTLAPWRMRRADIDALRTQGLDDLAVLHVVTLVAQQNAFTRMHFGRRAIDSSPRTSRGDVS